MPKNSSREKSSFSISITHDNQALFEVVKGQSVAPLWKHESIPRKISNSTINMLLKMQIWLYMTKYVKIWLYDFSNNNFPMILILFFNVCHQNNQLEKFYAFINIPKSEVYLSLSDFRAETYVRVRVHVHILLRTRVLVRVKNLFTYRGSVWFPCYDSCRTAVV